MEPNEKTKALLAALDTQIYYMFMAQNVESIELSRDMQRVGRSMVSMQTSIQLVRKTVGDSSLVIQEPKEIDELLKDARMAHVYFRAMMEKLDALKARKEFIDVLLDLRKRYYEASVGIGSANEPLELEA